MIFLTLLALYVIGAVGTAYSSIRWGDYGPDDDGFFFLCGFWPVAIPLIGVIFGFVTCVSYIQQLAERDAEKDRQKSIEQRDAERNKS